MDGMIEQLGAVHNTLDQVFVIGLANMKKIIGAAEAIQQVASALMDQEIALEKERADAKKTADELAAARLAMESLASGQEERV